MAVGVRPQPYRIDASKERVTDRLPQLLQNIDEMFQILFEDLYAVDQAAVAATSSSSSVTAGSPWVLISTSTPSGVSTVDFTGLSAYTDLRVAVVGVTFGSASQPRVRVSIDNGATYLAASGDYISIGGDGTTNPQTALDFYSGIFTAAKSGEIFIEGINVSGAPKFARSTFFSSDVVNLRYTLTTSVVNAVRVIASVNFTGGTIYLFGRV